jgi:hypothetical protein
MRYKVDPSRPSNLSRSMQPTDRRQVREEANDRELPPVLRRYQINASAWVVAFLLFPLPSSLAEAEQRQARSHARRAVQWMRSGAAAPGGARACFSKSISRLCVSDPVRGSHASPTSVRKVRSCRRASPDLGDVWDARPNASAQPSTRTIQWRPMVQRAANTGPGPSSVCFLPVGL